MGFQRRAESGEIFIEQRIFTFFEIARMFDDALAHFEGQVQAGKARVAAFERFDDAQGVKIVIEAIAKAAHLAVQLVFAGMSERRMADVVAQRESFGELFIEIERRGHGAGDLRDLDGVSKPVAKMIGNAGRKYLCFVFQAPESPGVDDAVAIALELAAVSVRQLGIAPAPAVLNGKTQTAQPVHRWAAHCRPVHLQVSELSNVMAALLTALRVLVRSGSTNLRARAQSLVWSRLASARVAASFETITVGWSITDWMSCAPSFNLPWAA